MTALFSFATGGFDGLAIATGCAEAGVAVGAVEVGDGRFEDRSVREDGVVGVVADVLRDDRVLGEVGDVLVSTVSAVTLRRVAGEVDCVAGNAFIGISSSISETLKLALAIVSACNNMQTHRGCNAS